VINWYHLVVCYHCLTDVPSLPAACSPFAGSWAVLSLGLLIFPENCQGIDQILSLRYVQELAPLAPGSSDAAEMVRSYAMNFAVRCFERLAFDDESLRGHVKTPVC